MDTYHRDGWCELPPLDPDTVAVLRERVEALSREDRPGIVHERGTRTVRAIHGCHAFDDVCERLTRLPQFVDVARDVLGDDVYVYQFKVNLKQPYEGAAWPWHQDYTFWRIEDGMPAPDALNIGIFLDDTHAGNGPLTVIPGSHVLGTIQEPRAVDRDWRAHVSADLAYTISDVRAESLRRRFGSRALVGPAGSAYAFHPDIVHSSSNNRSGDRRALLLVTYNAVRNAPPRPTRPEFLVSRDTTPVVALPDRDHGLVPIASRSA